MSRATIAAAVLTVALSGCGSSGDSATGSSTSTGSTTSSATSSSATTSSASTTSSSAATSSTTAASTSTAAATGSTTCPSTAELLAAWKAYPQSVPGVTGFSNTTCWDHWVISFPEGPGDGAIAFSTTPKLHVTTPAEAEKFHTEVCAAKDSPSGWKNDESITVC